jgi:hypothetical protein
MHRSPSLASTLSPLRPIESRSSTPIRIPLVEPAAARDWPRPIIALPH